MRRVLMLAVAIVFAGSLGAQTAADVQAKFNEAAELYNAKDHVKAIALFEETIDMGLTAEDDVEKIVETAKKFLATACVSAGASAAKNADFDTAITYLSKGSDAAGDQNFQLKNRAETMISKVYEVQGNSFLAKEDYNGAAAIYMKGVERNERNTTLATRAAQCYAKAGDMTKAEGLYKSVIELGSSNSRYASAAEEAKDAYAADMLSTSMEDAKNGKFEDVKTTVNKVFEIAPGNATAYMILLQAANAAKKYDDIIAIAGEAVAAQTQEVDKSNASMIVGAAYQNKGDKAKAIAAYKAVTAGPNVAAAQGATADLAK